MSSEARTPDSATGPDTLGGRLALLPVERLSAAQRQLHERITATRVRTAGTSGYVAALPDGRLIGPFNAFLRMPAIAEAQLAWAQALSASDIPADVREVVILTVAAQWRAEYVLYAHRIAGVAAGLNELTVAALADGESPLELNAFQTLGHRLTLALVREHQVAPDLYDQVIDCFGEPKTAALVALIGQYLTTSALVTCFAVPAPSPA